MQFKKITIEEIDLFKTYFEQLKFGICDYSVGGLFMWRDYYNMEYALKDSVLYSRLYNKNEEVFYNIPLGIDLLEGIETLKKEVEQDKIKFCTTPEIILNEIKKKYSNITIQEQVNFADYLYSSDDLRTLSGKKYSGQRNMIHQFLRENQNWIYETINENNVQDIEEFLIGNYRVDDKATDFEKEEENKVIEVLKNFNKYGFIGSMLKTNGMIVGFSLGEIIDDRVYVHIEKANRNIKGAYQMLVNQFALKYTNEKIKYINREEDIGDLGLRESKKSYHPIELLKKYIIEV